MSTELLKELVDAGVHFGHQSKKWNPRMKPFLLEKRNNIHLINLEETARQLETAAQFLSKLAAEQKKILFVGCKRQAQDAVKEAADVCQQFYVNHRWLGGTLTNLASVAAKLTTVFALKLSYATRYVNAPAPGIETTDTITSMALVAKF